MKLLFDATELSYYNDNSGHRAGVFHVALNVLREFIKSGVDITLQCDYRRYYFLKNTDEFKNLPLLEEHSLINKFWGKLLYFTDKFPIRFKYGIIILTRFYDAWFYKNNRKNQEQLKFFDAYFSPYTPPSKEIAESELKKFRVIHDTIPVIDSGLPKSPKDWYYKIYSTINNKEYYFTDSESTRNDVIKYFDVTPENVKTALLGVSENFFPDYENAPIKEKYVFSLCTLGKRKNLEFSIHNFFNFIGKNKIDDLKLVLGGSIWEKYKKDLNNILNKYDRSKVILTGYISDNELKKYYSNAMMFIFPSLYEGFGLPVLEAMACGCPVITSKTSSLPEVIGDAGIKINPESDEEMVEAFERMYFDNIFRALCSEQGLNRAKLFRWDKYANEIMEFIASKL